MSGWACRTYYNVNPFIGVSWHDTVGPIPLPPFMRPVKLPHIDFSVVQGLWLGSFLSNGRDKEVVSEDLLFIGRMSDAGLGIPHISIPPSWLNVLTSLFASSNSIWGSSSVTIACKNLLWGNEDCDIAATPFGKVPLSINLGCFDPISLPTDVVIVWGSVYVGMSWADILAAVIDMALTIVMDAVMCVGGKVLKKYGGKLLKKAFGAGKKGAKKATSSGLKKAWKATKKKVITTAKSATGDIPSDSYKKYLKKATQIKASAEKLGMSNADLSEFADTSNIGSKYFKEAMGNLDEGVDKWTKKYTKYVDNLSEYADYGRRDVEIELDHLKSLDGLVDDSLAEYATKQTRLKNALKELNEAFEEVKLGEKLWEFEFKGAKKSASKILYRHLFVYANAFGEGTEGGLLSFDGLGWTEYFRSNRAFQDRWFVKMGLFNLDESLSDEDESEYWDDAYVDTGDFDYWFGNWSGDDEPVTADDDYVYTRP